MRPEDLGWLAGILDGEGTITLLARSREGRSHRQPTLSATSTDREILEHLVKLVGGNISRVVKYKAHHKDAWIWKLNGGSCVLEVLQAVRPWLKAPKKRRRAEFLLQRYDAVTQRNGCYTAEQRQAKEAFEQQFFEIA